MCFAVQNGFIRFAYQAGESGVKTVGATDRRVDDGDKHSIAVRRVGTLLSIELDSKTIDYGDIPESLSTPGNIFIGAVFFQVERDSALIVFERLSKRVFLGCYRRITRCTLHDGLFVFGKLRRLYSTIEDK